MNVTSYFESNRILVIIDHFSGPRLGFFFFLPDSTPTSQLGTDRIVPRTVVFPGRVIHCTFIVTLTGIACDNTRTRVEQRFPRPSHESSSAGTYATGGGDVGVVNCYCCCTTVAVPVLLLTGNKIIIRTSRTRDDLSTFKRSSRSSSAVQSGAAVNSSPLDATPERT